MKKFIYESLEELFESPDWLSLNGQYDRDGYPSDAGKDVKGDNFELDYESSDAHPFWLDQEGAFHLGPPGRTHPMGTIRKDGMFPGRLWFHHKIMSFWEYPDKETFFDMVKKMGDDLKYYYPEDEYRIINDPEWKVEIIPSNPEIVTDPETGVMISGPWRQLGEFQTTIIPISDYKFSEKRSEEELGTEHIKSPLLKKKKVPQGWGSTHPKYQERRAWNMASLTGESVNFERGKNPLDSMKIGSYAKREVKATCPSCDKVYNYTNDNVINVMVKNIWGKKIYNYYIQCPFCNAGFIIDTKIKLEESLNFERGSKDPKKYLGIGLREVIINKCQKFYNINQNEGGEIVIETITCNRWAIEIHTNQDPYKTVGKYLIGNFKDLGLDQYLDLSEDNRTEAGNYDTAFTYKFKKEYKGIFDEGGKQIYITDYTDDETNYTNESQHFTREGTPLEKMDIGSEDGRMISKMNRWAKEYSFEKSGLSGTEYDPEPEYTPIQKWIGPKNQWIVLEKNIDPKSILKYWVSWKGDEFGKDSGLARNFIDYGGKNWEKYFRFGWELPNR